MKKEKTYEINKLNYTVFKDEYNVFDHESVKTLMTDYFNDYDYVFGDYAYNKLRLKGFYEKRNKKCNNTNNIENLDNYINNYCAYKCKWFLLKKIK